MRVYDDEGQFTIIEIDKVEVMKVQKELWIKLEDGFEIDISFQELDRINATVKKAFNS